MKYEAKSVIFGRKPREEGCEFKTAFFRLFDTEEPFSAEFPKDEIDFKNIEKVEMKSQDVDYYLEGNDLVIKGITAINIDQEGKVLKISVE